MKFGLYLSHQYPPEDSLPQRITELVDFVQTGRDLGFDSLFVLHHYAGNLQTLQPLTLLANLAAHSGQMQLGTGVLILPLLHPLHVAEEVATLDQVSSGRVILGVGAGYRDNEFAAFGVDKESRGGRFRESLDLVRRLMGGEEVTHQGKFYSLNGVRAGVLPVQRPYPPIWIGAQTDKTIRRAAELADAWVAPPSSKLRWAARMVEHYQACRSELGRSSPTDMAIMLETALAPDGETARREALPYILKEYEYYSEYGLQWLFRDRFQELANESFLFGSPAEVSAHLINLARAGYNHFLFRCAWGGMPHDKAMRTLRLLAEQVMPEVRAALDSNSPV